MIGGHHAENGLFFSLFSELLISLVSAQELPGSLEQDVDATGFGMSLIRRQDHL